MKKTFLGLGPFLILLIVVVGAIFSFTTYKNNIREQKIYDNLLGATFYYEKEEYSGEVTSPYTICWLKNSEYSITFNSDGTVQKYTMLKSVPYEVGSEVSLTSDYELKDEYNDKYDSFEVVVTFDGDVYVKFEDCRYPVQISSDSDVFAERIDYDSIDVCLERLR